MMTPAILSASGTVFGQPMWPFLALVFAFQLAAQAKLNVVATLPDLGAIAREIGGDKINLKVLAQGTEDPHFVDPRPSFVRLLNQADVLIEGGCELEAGWLPPLLQTARNRNIQGTAPGHIIASKDVSLLDIPQGPVDRSQGDVHLSGNPHYLLDPANGKIVAATITGTFGSLDPDNAGFYEGQLRNFQERLDKQLARWVKELQPYRGATIITYHKTFDYFLKRFDFVLADTIEPKPGIEPSPSHVQNVIRRAKERRVRLIVIEPNRGRKTPQMIAESAGAKLVVLPALVGGHELADDFFHWFDYNVAQIRDALREP